MTTSEQPASSFWAVAKRARVEAMRVLRMVVDMIID